MIAVSPISETHALGLCECLDSVARERRYLALTQAPPLAQMVAFVRENVAQDAVQFVALDGARVVGWADIVAGWAPATAHTGTLGMGVLAEYRGRGIGASLLDACLQKALKKGITRVELTARADNAAAIRLYERMGFVHEGVKRGAMRHDGVDRDCVLMARLA